jgi:hypothetical protein
MMQITVPFGTDAVQHIVQGNGDARHQKPLHGLHALLHSMLVSLSVALAWPSAPCSCAFSAAS